MMLSDVLYLGPEDKRVEFQRQAGGVRVFTPEEARVKVLVREVPVKDAGRTARSLIARVEEQYFKPIWVLVLLSEQNGREVVVLRPPQGKLTTFKGATPHEVHDAAASYLKKVLAAQPTT